ncbi:MAG: ROK family protein [Gammaproteobacteria bacterium]
MDFKTQKLLLIDIGGTNFRSAIGYLGSNEIQDTKKQNLDSLNNFNKLINDLMEEYGQIDHAVFSVAGPKIENAISMTNRDFKIDIGLTKEEFGFKTCHLLNDWESIGYSLASTDTKDIQFIQTGSSFNDTSLMIGPGTGLGAAFISKNVVFPTEVGNTRFTFQKILIDAGIKNIEQFSVLEDVLSGRGISRLHQNFSGEFISPEEIIKKRQAGDESAVKAINTFIDFIALSISDLALTYMPGSGIYMAGGLMRSIFSFIDHESFIKNFIGQHKPMHQELLQKMSIGIITREMTCLYGNLAFLNSKLMKS